MSLPDRKKIKYLIVDTSAFIKNAALEELGENILTVDEVVNEVTSKRQLRRLVVLPYDLKIKDTFPEHVKFVSEFAKKTGDFLSLSVTDIKVIALTYQIEKEQVGVDHLRNEPVHKPVICLNEGIDKDFQGVAGFYNAPKKTSNIQCKDVDGGQDGDSSNYQTASENESSDYEESETTLTAVETNVSEDEFEEAVAEENSLQEDKNASEELSDEDELEENSEILKRVDMNTEENMNQNSSDDDVDDSDGDDEDEDDDEKGWITPANIKEAKRHINDNIANEVPVVACLTTDFAMQNVLKQIGLKVITIDGCLIKDLRTWIFRCYACFKTTSVMTKIFCPNCGHKTLKRVAVSVDSEGNQKIHINMKRPLTARGKKYSLPRPQGGKHACNPILCEDQPLPQQRVSKLSRKQNDPMAADYIAGYSPFTVRDVTSKAAMLGIRSAKDIPHWMKKNPNEVRKTNRRKKK